MTKELSINDMLRRDIADMQSEIHTLQLRVKELVEERDKAISDVENLQVQLNIHDYWNNVNIA